jgi:hypothetical protein
MEEPHIEGLATHDDPESCGGAGNGAVEALTGACAGRVLSREIKRLGRRRRPERRKATRAAPLSRGVDRPCAVRDPVHAQNLPVREPGGPHAAHE